MVVCIDHVLTAERLGKIRSLLETAEFDSGKVTAGTFAKTVKTNEQLRKDADSVEAIAPIILSALQGNALFQAIARPKIIRPPLVNRYSTGMAYGWHADNAIMGNPRVRSDISITLWISDPETYEGGELLIDTAMGEQAFKLAAGAMVVYPSTSLHCVTEVTSGVRLAAVTWVQSLIRDAQQRELLFDLDTARRSIFEKYGKTAEFDLLSKTHANLLRQWVEV
ncbi:MAG: Fe2+-dependent dioxygenase [Elainellaceae cyanobacterium]